MLRSTYPFHEVILTLELVPMLKNRGGDVVGALPVDLAMAMVSCQSLSEN